jgi:hypothetical protein
MQEQVKFPKTMAALARVEGTTWGVVDALVAEVETTKSGMAKKGQYEAISKEAAKNGFVNPSSGNPWAPGYLGKLREVGMFVNSDEVLGVELRKYPIGRVTAAAGKAKGDPAKALEILATGKTVNEIGGWLPPSQTNVKSKEQARQIIKTASPALRKAMVEEAMIDPDVARAVASDEKMQETFIHARLDDSYRKATGKPIRPTGPARLEDEEEEAGPLRHGLAYIIIGTHLEKAKR